MCINYRTTKSSHVYTICRYTYRNFQNTPLVGMDITFYDFGHNFTMLFVFCTKMKSKFVGKIYGKLTQVVPV